MTVFALHLIARLPKDFAVRAPLGRHTQFRPNALCWRYWRPYLGARCSVLGALRLWLLPCPCPSHSSTLASRMRRCDTRRTCTRGRSRHLSQPWIARRKLALPNSSSDYSIPEFWCRFH